MKLEIKTTELTVYWSILVNIICEFASFTNYFFETGFHFVTQTRLKFIMQPRWVSNLSQSSCLSFLFTICWIFRWSMSLFCSRLIYGSCTVIFSLDLSNHLLQGNYFSERCMMDLAINTFYIDSEENSFYFILERMKPRA